jgi:hypothetical protein
VTASSGMPPALNIIALATFSAALSARALDPVGRDLVTLR